MKSELGGTVAYSTWLRFRLLGDTVAKIAIMIVLEEVVTVKPLYSNVEIYDVCANGKCK